MEVERFYLGCLAHASYLVHDNGEAAVIDPQRDVEIYVDRARELGVSIRWVLETHLHADFVSGHLELASRTGAGIGLGAGSGARFDHLELEEGDELSLGSGVLRILSTPGHTEESICILVPHAGQDGQSVVFTGDTLFIGDVGRPDLSPTRSPQQLAALLYESLHRKLLPLPDDTVVYPAHGAGSLCGKQMSADSSSTIGRERRENYALKAASSEEFVELLTGELPPRPAYFEAEVERNRSGAAGLEQLARVAELSPTEVKQLQAGGATLLDTRPMREFAAAHLPGAIHIALGGQFASWAARVLGLDRNLILVGEDQAAVEEARLRLARVGIESVAGMLAGGLPGWVEAGLSVESLNQISARELDSLQKQAPFSGVVLDVREPSERLTGFIPGSIAIPLPELPGRLAELDRNQTIVVHCKGGYRSSIAASLLQSAGFPNIVNLTGGFDAWKLSVPTTMSAPSDSEAFLADYPGYGAPEKIDSLRRTEYNRLDASNQVYLDYTGGSLYGESQLRRHLEFMAAGVFGNPHSANRASAAMTEHVELARAAVLRYFHASPDEYVAAFTLNASGALKLIGEAFPFTAASRYLMSFDNHNSVNGIREFALAKGANVEYTPLTMPELRLDLAELDARLDRLDRAAHNLFAFPAQSNFTGVKHPLDLVAHAQAKGWNVLLDAAAFAPTNRLDLSEVKPDFTVFSFYKMFGYPTGIGALLVRREAFDRLKRPWFAGGTVNFVTVQGRSHVLAHNEGALEDGTVNYLSIPAVRFGLEYLEAIGVESIGARVEALAGWLISRLVSFKHSNGRPMVRIYGPLTTDWRGGTVTMNFNDPAGRLLDYRRIEELANTVGISIRTGCFCNPGANETAEGLTEDDMRAGEAHGDSLTLQSFVRLMRERGSGKSAGAIRVSFGIASNFEDARRFADFAESFRDRTQLNIGEVTIDADSCRVIRDGS